MKAMLEIFLYSYHYYAYVFSSSKLEIRAEQLLPGSEGVKGLGGPGFWVGEK
jgi:hypothetical protein